MFQNYIKTTLRNMARHKGYAILNVAGLSIGLAVCFLLFLWVKDELSYDRFHENSDRTYQSLWKARFGENEWEIPLVPAPLAGLMEREFPEVEWATQAYKGGVTLKKGQEWVREKNVLFVDEDFFKVFTVEALEGIPSAALEDPRTLLITAESSQRYFGADPNVVGRIIQQNDGSEWKIGGIVKKWPSQSHLQFNFLAPLANIENIENRKNSWGSATCFTYFTVKKGSDINSLNEKLEAWVEANQMQADFWKQGKNYTSFPFQPLTEIHLKPNRSYIWVFGIIALFILSMASINFINLATARSLTRAREVGVRKVLGSARIQLVRQFFIEAFVYVTVSILLAVFIAEMVLPFFNELAGKELTINFLDTPFVWLLLGGLLLMTTLMTGIFPAMVLSAFDPSKVLKGGVGLSGGKSRMRQGLVILQFCISTALVIGTLVVKNQMDYLQTHELGFEKEHVLVVRQATALGNKYDPFIERVLSIPAVEQVSVSQFLPGDGFDSSVFIPEQPSNYKQTSLSYTHIDENFVDALKLNIIAGRNIDLNHKTDSTAVLINVTAAERLGWKNPIGKKLSWGGSPGGEVVGLVQDFNFFSLHDEIEPLVMRMAAGWNPSNIVIRLHAGNVGEQLSDIQSAWKEMAPQAPLQFSFLDQDFQKQYEKEERMSSVFLLFAGISIFIACLGLFGLAAFMAAQRTKEIGIRKVLGASTVGLVGLLSKDFLKLVALSLLIASPIAYFLMEKWLQDFAYRIDIQWPVFAIAGMVAIGVAFLTVGFKSVEAALNNPVESLRNE